MDGIHMVIKYGMFLEILCEIITGDQFADEYNSTTVNL